MLVWVNRFKLLFVLLLFIWILMFVEFVGIRFKEIFFDFIFCWILLENILFNIGILFKFVFCLGLDINGFLLKIFVLVIMLFIWFCNCENFLFNVFLLIFVFELFVVWRVKVCMCWSEFVSLDNLVFVICL